MSEFNDSRLIWDQFQGDAAGADSARQAKYVETNVPWWAAFKPGIDALLGRKLTPAPSAPANAQAAPAGSALVQALNDSKDQRITLGRGDHGEVGKDVQKLLIAGGFLAPTNAHGESNVDGKLYGDSFDAVSKFRKAAHLSSTGALNYADLYELQKRYSSVRVDLGPVDQAKARDVAAAQPAPHPATASTPAPAAIEGEREALKTSFSKIQGITPAHAAAIAKDLDKLSPEQVHAAYAIAMHLAKGSTNDPESVAAIQKLLIAGVASGDLRAMQNAIQTFNRQQGDRDKPVGIITTETLLHAISEKAMHPDTTPAVAGDTSRPVRK